MADDNIADSWEDEDPEDGIIDETKKQEEDNMRRKSELRDKIVDFLKNNSGQAFQAGIIANKIGEDNARVGVACWSLEKQGIIQKIGKGEYGVDVVAAGMRNPAATEKTKRKYTMKTKPWGIKQPVISSADQISKSDVQSTKQANKDLIDILANIAVSADDKTLGICCRALLQAWGALDD